MKQKDGEVQVGGMARAVMLVLRFRALALILFLVITGALCLQLPNIKATSDSVTPLIPPRHPFASTLQAIEGMNTLPEQLMVIVEVQSGDIYNKETAEKVERIAGELVGVQEIKPGGIRSLSVGLNHYESSVEGLMGEPILGRIPPETEEDFQAVKRRVAVNSLGIGTSVAYDGTATLITAPLVDLDTKLETTYKQLFVKEQTGLSLEEHKKKELDAFHQRLLGLVRDLKAREEDGNHTLHFIGTRTLAAEMTEMARRQVPLAVAATLVLVLLLLAVYFRSFRGTLLPVLVLGLSLLWALGMLGASGMVWNPMGLLFPVMLGVLSLVCIAQVMNEVDRSREEVAGKKQAIAVAYGRAPVVASVLAAGLVSITLLVACIPMLRELGAFGLFWAVGTFVVVALIGPVLISLFPGPAKAKGEGRGGLFAKVAEGMSSAFQGRKRVVLWALLVAALAAGGLCAWKLDVGNNTPGASYIRSTHPWNQGFRLFAERFNGPYSLLVHVKAKEEEGLLHPEAIREMGDFSTYVRGEGGARESVAFDWVVKLGRIALMDGNPKWWTVPASREDVEGLARLLTFPGGLEVLVDKAFSQATIASLFPKDDAESIDDYVSRMEGYIESHPSEHLEFSLAGGLLAVTKAINDGTRQDYVKTLALAFIAVFVVGILVTRSAFSSLIFTLSLVAAQAAACLIMKALGGAISLATVPAAVVGVGFGAVLGMYLVRQVDAQGGPPNDAGKPLGFLHHLLPAYDAIHKAELKSLVCIHQFTGEQDLHGPGIRELPGQLDTRAGHRKDGPLDLLKTELRVFRCNANVRGIEHLHAACDGMAVYGRDDRFVQLEALEECLACNQRVFRNLLLHLALRLLCPGEQGDQLSQVCAGTERLVPCTGDDGASHLPVIPVILPRRHQLEDRLRIEGVARLGPIQCKIRDSFLLFVDQSHSLSSLRLGLQHLAKESPIYYHFSRVKFHPTLNPDHAPTGWTSLCRSLIDDWDLQRKSNGRRSATRKPSRVGTALSSITSRYPARSKPGRTLSESS